MSMDITSLYTNIPYNEGIQASKEMLAIHRPPNDLPHNSDIIELLEVVLTSSHFEFNDRCYHQVSGTAMGTKLAPSYANLFMTNIEEKYVYTSPLQSVLWKRFIGDIFLIWPHGREPLLKFINHLNTVHPTIKFTKEISPIEIPFLDLIIYIRESRLCMRLYTKPTDRHMYLNFSSKHPMSVKNSIPNSQFPRLSRIHTESQYLLEAQLHMYLLFLWREYPHDTIMKAGGKQIMCQGSNYYLKQRILILQKHHSCVSLPTVELIQNFKEIISKHWPYLGRSSATRELGKQDFMITYRKLPSLRIIWVRARISQPTTHSQRGARGHIPANIVEEYPNQDIFKTYKTIKPTKH